MELIKLDDVLDYMYEDGRMISKGQFNLWTYELNGVWWYLIDDSYQEIEEVDSVEEAIHLFNEHLIEWSKEKYYGLV